MSFTIIAALWIVAGGDRNPAAGSAADYDSRVFPVLKKYCAGCHNDEDREGKFSVESYASLKRGSKHGPAFLPGDSRGSRIVRVMTGAAKPAMPPKDEPQPNQEEIALIGAWIDAGALGPKGQEPDRKLLIVPKIKSHAKVSPIVAMDATRDGRLIAIARGGEVALYASNTPRNGTPERSLKGFPGKVTALHFSGDGTRLVTASGIAGLTGEAAIWNVADGSLMRGFEGGRDILYDAEVSPDGTKIATCGYDKKIAIWNVSDGKVLHTLEGHTGAVYDVAFSPDGRFLVSASADDTCKVWRVEDGVRMDTLPQPLEAEYACAFSPDGRTIVAAGADKNIRVWRFVSREKPEINPMEIARFAHEGAIIRIAFSSDGSKLVTLAEDRTVKVWRTSDYSEIQLWDAQSDIPSALAFLDQGDRFQVGRLDGSIGTYTIPADSAVERTGESPGKLVDSKRAVNLDSVSIHEIKEIEPNDLPAQANVLSLPARISGVIDHGKTVAADRGKSGKVDRGEAVAVDRDCFRFSAKAGERLVIEVNAARSGSKLDSYIEILDSQGDRIPRVLLQAVRDSYFTFRGKDGSETDDFRVFNQAEMKINEYLYANGEVVRLWLYPRGPDSGFKVYPGRDNRWGYFDTTPLAHALGEPCYIVEPHAPGAKLVPNGLPVFTIYYENDDDSRREFGKDSRLYFTTPADGDYVIKIKDVRGIEGSDFRYSLTIREPRPDFKVELEGVNPKVAAGSAKEFKVSAQRIDGFDEPIRVDITNLPPGFRVTTPLLIEADQIDAFGVVTAEPGAKRPEVSLSKASKVTATARIGDREITHDVNNLGTIELAPEPKVRIAIVPAEGGAKPLNPSGPEPLEFAIEPGQTIMLKVKVDRNGFSGQVPFGNEGSGRNLPFGVIVDNLGLNGLLILDNQIERTFFVTADAIVPEQVRAFHLTTSVDGGRSSPPVLLRVRKPRLEAARSSAINQQ